MTPPPRDPASKPEVVTPYAKTMLAASKRAEACKRTKATKDPQFIVCVLIDRPILIF